MRIVVAGAGFAGLAAARALEGRGAEVLVVEARDRVGGRVWTIREGFAGQHAEGGADMVDSDHMALLGLARELGVETTKILRGGFGFYGRTKTGRLAFQPISETFRAIDEPLRSLVDEYQLAEQRWDGPIAARLARESVADWLDRVGAHPWLRQRLCALRGLFLADPEDLSLLALVDFLAADPWSGGSHSVRFVGGNDRVATEIARRLRTPPQLRTVLRRVSERRRGVTVTLDRDGTIEELHADGVVSALPASTLRDVEFHPALPETQQTAIRRLRYGCATRVLLQFPRRFWRHPGRPRAFGSDQPTGAVWEGNEEQRGPAGILSLLAGGGASSALQEIVATEGMKGVVRRLRWLGRAPAPTGSTLISWERDRWAHGGYAYFDPAFDPAWREVLARPFGRVTFAGEHTHNRWQGYMNGAVESGLRAAAETAILVGGDVGGLTSPVLVK